jgi:hypothetical protein
MGLSSADVEAIPEGFPGSSPPVTQELIGVIRHRQPVLFHFQHCGQPCVIDELPMCAVKVCDFIGAVSLLAYNLGNLWRRLVLPRGIENWSLTSLQQRLVKTGGRLVKHARYYWLLLAESHLTRRRFGAMLGRISLLPIPTG